MRNLRNTRHTQIKFSETDLPLTATAWDADTDGLICAFGPTETEAVIELKRFEKDAFIPDDGRLIASWDAPCPLPNLPCDKILSARYFAETQSTCLILAGGDLVVVRESPQAGEDLIEIVGSVDAGINAAAWSPDDELVAISTKADTFILMTRLFESTANVQMAPDDVKVSAHVSVGWGKSETQFKGKRAKAMRDPTVPEHVDEGALSQFDAGETTISWRGDGAYVAINTVEESRRRIIRVYSREGVLDSVSEPVDGLEGALSWRPAGNLLAGIQHRTDGTLYVVFFERNGLRHGEFGLRFATDSMPRPEWTQRMALAWNNDSTVLAVSFQDRVQLWTMGNYHYYLKQEVCLPQQTEPISVSWHSEKALYLTAFARDDLRHLNYTSQISGGSVSSPTDFGIAAVMDGTSLKLTPLRVANVPPPMSFIDFTLPGNAIDLSCNKDASLIAVLYHAKVETYRLDLLGPNPTDLHLDLSIGLPVGYSVCHPRQIEIGAKNDIFILSSTANEPVDRVSALIAGEWIDVDTPTSSTMISSIRTRSDYETICYQDAPQNKSASSVYSIEASPAGLAPEKLSDLPMLCPRFEVWKEEDTTIIFGLTAGGTLCAQGRSSGEPSFNQRLQVRGVTSFLTTPSHLILTTSQHLVKFVHLHEGDLEIPLDEPEKDERCRSIERGARLVTVMPSAYALVLQMPRGNLETIYPRALVLAGIRKAILAKNYRKAFSACRNHRVDMNILHDYAPEQFMSSIESFVDQLKKPSHIDLFLSQLRDEDVTETLYKETLNAPKLGLHAPQPHGTSVSTDPTSSSSKTNRICSAFIATLSTPTRQSTHLQTLITSHVCKNPPDLESGLRLLSSLRTPSTTPDDPSVPDPASNPALDRATEHICFLSDAHRLYDTALGLYDLDVALLVAQHAQKDPREYLPYLQSLQTMPDLRRKFTIDNDLRRYGKAIAALLAMGQDVWEETLRYVVRHELYGEAVEGVKYQREKRGEVMRLWAEWLGERNRFKEAGIAWEGLGEYTLASEMYQAGGMWRECLSTARLGGRGEEEVRILARGLAEGKEEEKEYAAAAVVWGEYLGDVEGCVRCWCKAYRFDEAVRVVSLKGNRGMLGLVDSGLAEGFAAMSEMLAEMKTQIGAQVGRLRELREKKRLDPLGFYDGTPASNNPDIPDDVSLAPSMNSTSAGTFMTRYTNRTASTLATNTTRKSSKNRRREERKKARGKKGSVYEEEYLVSSIGRLVERLNSISEEVQRLVEGLMRRDMRERGVAVQTLMKEVAEAAKASLPEVYEQDVGVQRQVVEVNAEMDGEGEALPPVNREVPVLKSFEGLSLLG
ncbi:Elongator complex protein 1 [Elsinoe australis]|uniref:Elongator complex protein 1 n=1 Tax=Elsinoe australis TaxID=40998 RepID=A0A2P7YET8_9PEZI|nr:Elongator complex protein 1 [Elsinoe australis]